MFYATGSTITDDTSTDVPVLEWKFDITNGNTGEMTVSDPLLKDQTVALERAKSEFLKNSYRLKEVVIQTWRTDLTKNQVISIYGVPYLIKEITTVITDKSMKSIIRGVRYE